MPREDLIQVEGVVTEVMAHGQYGVTLVNKHKVVAKLCGKMRKFFIKVMVGDKVTIGLSPYDKSNGLILFRHKTSSTNTVKPPRKRK